MCWSARKGSKEPQVLPTFSLTCKGTEMNVVQLWLITLSRCQDFFEKKKSIEHIPRREAASSMLICNSTAASLIKDGSTSSTSSSCTWIVVTKILINFLKWHCNSKFSLLDWRIIDQQMHRSEFQCPSNYYIYFSKTLEMKEYFKKKKNWRNWSSFPK